MVDIAFGNTLRYRLLIQQVDGDSAVANSTEVRSSLTLPAHESGDYNRRLAVGAIDEPVVVNDFPGVDLHCDFLAILATADISFKLNSVTGTAIYLRAEGVCVLDSKNIQNIYLSNPGATVAKVWVIQGVRQ